jgi:RNA polymerase sigma-70 factor (ECF subfamily)
MKSGAFMPGGVILALSMALFSVPVTSGFLTTRTGIVASRTVFLEDHPETLDTVTGASPEDTLIRLDNQAALHTALEQLHPSLREVILLCDVEEIKYKDIAVILDVPIGTVMSRISRARRTLRQLLQPQLGESL